MTTLDRLRAPLQVHPQVGDALLAVSLLVLVLFAPDPDRVGDAARTTTTEVLVAIATCAPLVVRRRWPKIVLALTTAGAMVAVVSAGGHAALAFAALVATYTVAVRSDRRTTWIAWATSATALTTALIFSTAGADVTPQVFAYVGWSGAGAAAGDALRNRRAYVTAIEERAVRAEQTREEEAGRRVAEERLRIARDLHDVVAHRIAVINVQAGVAAHLLSSQPKAAEEALGQVREASRAILDELSDILNVLRQPGEAVDPTAPSPSLARLDDLVASFAAVGLTVDWSLTGLQRDVGAAVDLVAYRVLEEALTNAHKHGTGSATVSVEYTAAAVALRVGNPVSRPQIARNEGRIGNATGHGLIGMRERTAAVNGVLQVAQGTDGRFRVEAILPVHGVSAS